MKLASLFTLFALALTSCARNTRLNSLAVDEPSSRGESVPTWWVGAWKREWVEFRGKSPDFSTVVRTVQTPILYGDIRIPRDRLDFSHANSLADLTDEELRKLFHQDGFSGATSFRGEIATWSHDINYQPAGAEDIGTFERLGPSEVYESGLDGSYRESWWRLSSGDGKFLGVKVTKSRNDAERTDRILSVAGDHFVYARNRPKDLPPAKSWHELVARTHPTRSELLEYLDCELSYGLVRGGNVPWEIQRSTLPWREGKQLDFANEITADQSGVLSPKRAAPDEKWVFPVNTFHVHDLQALFPANEVLVPGR